MFHQRTKAHARLLGALFSLWAGVGVGAASTASAQDLTERATVRCVQAAVRLEVDLGRAMSTGSGAIIDSRGYILTNFHVVGLTRHEEGMGIPGAFYGDGQHVRIATVSSARDSADAEYLGRVVRGDVQLDLAIVRIVSMLDGSPIPDGTTFPTIELTDTEGLNPGAAVWAFGFPMGVRTINVTSGNVSGFEMNAERAVAWIRTDVEFNPGNSGGMLVDRRGRLVAVPTAVVSSRDTLEPIELARPVERMPAAWRTALESGAAIDDVQITGIRELTAGASLSDRAIGDAGGMGREEVHYYSLPGAAAASMASITTTPAIPIGLLDARGRVLREGRGTLVVGPGEAGGVVAVLFERPEDGSATEVALRLDIAASSPAVAGGYPAAGGGPDYPESGGGPGAGPPSAGVPGAGAVSIRGRLIDAVSGAPVSGGVVYIGRADVDLARLFVLWQARRITDAQFGSALVGYGMTDATGAYAIAGIPRGRFSGITAAAGYASAPIALTITPADPGVVEVTPIRMSR